MKPTNADIKQEIDEIRQVFTEQSTKRLTCYLLLETALTLTTELRANDRQIRARLSHLRAAINAAKADSEVQPTKQTDQEDKTPVIITNLTTGGTFGWETAPTPVLDQITEQIAQGQREGLIEITHSPTCATVYAWKIEPESTGRVTDPDGQ